MTRSLPSLALAVLLAAGCEEQALPARAEPTALPAAKVEAEPRAPAPAPPSFDQPEGTHYFAPGADGKLHVWFLDVGQGDAVLIKAPSGRTVLVDGGPAEAASHLMRRLPELLEGPLDLVVITHPHVDHYGALGRALQVVKAQRVMALPPAAGQDAAYRQLLAFLEEQGLPFHAPSAPADGRGQPLRIALGDGAALAVYWPRAPVEALLDAAHPVDANSVVMRLEYKETSVLLMGDATADTEKYLLARRWPFRSTLLKVGAHGDDVATSGAFAHAVRPEAAIVSVGAGNARGSPSRAVVERLREVGADVYRTDLDGEIRADSDGETFVLITERPPVGEAPETPHLYGRKGDGFAQSMAQDVRRTRGARAGDDAPEEVRPSFGKVIEVRPDGTSQVTGAAAARPVASARRYVASRNSEVFHLPSCGGAKRIHKKNLLVFSTRAEAARGRRPAKDCDP